MATSGLLENHFFPAQSYPEIKKAVTEFRSQVNVERDRSKNKEKLEYYSTVGYGGLAKTENRKKRTTILKNPLPVYVIPKDAQAS